MQSKYSIISSVLLIGFLLVTQASAASWSVDPDFNPNVSDHVFALTLQSDGKILIGGNFQTVNGIAQGRISRVNESGLVDTGFSIGTGANAGVFTLLLQPDNKILVGGTFTSFNGLSEQRITRLNLDGSDDITFFPNSNPTISGAVYSMLRFDTGQIILGGTMNKYTPSNATFIPLKNMARLTTTGAFDNAMGNPNGRVSTMALQSDNKIVIGGSFSAVSGNGRRIARLTTFGALDTTFSPTTNGAVATVMVQSDDKVVFAGQFTEVGGTARTGIARVSINGNLDSNFSTSVNGLVYSIVQQEDSKILIGGDFTEVNGETRNRIARLNADGSLDTSLDVSVNSTVRQIAIEENGDLIIAGNFTEIDGSAHNRLARIKAPTEDELCLPIKASSGQIAVVCL